MISCRNVMIYLGQDLQQKVVPLFHYALRSGGYLFLGPSENVTSKRELFETVDKKNRIFQRKETVPRPTITFPLGDISRPVQRGAKLAPADERNLPRQLERIILERYGPACVIVKENGEGVYFSDRSSLYLRQPAGAPEANVVNMAGDGLRITLRTALHRAVTGPRAHCPETALGSDQRRGQSC
jgi:two-component system, chemotaxis family, CheB/CheR fusion protein